MSDQPHQPTAPQPAPPAAYPPATPPAAYPPSTPYAGRPAYAVGSPWGPLAGWGTRVAAYLIDGLLQLVGALPYVIGIILFIAGAPRSGAYDSTSSDYAPVKAANPGLMIAGAVLLLAGLLLMLGIQIWNRTFRQGRTGQSIGKKTMGIKLVDERTGQPIGAGMSF